MSHFVYTGSNRSSYIYIQKVNNRYTEHQVNKLIINTMIEI